MDKTFRWSVIIGVSLIVGAVLVVGGMLLGRFVWGMWDYHPAAFMMGGGQGGYNQSCGGPGSYGMMGGGYGPGAAECGMRGNFGTGVANGGEPLSLEQAEHAVEAYLDDLGDDDLSVSEVMVFDNHAYAEVVEESTGIGAFEVLIDPTSLAVRPEYGPNMMWNTRYGHHAGGRGMMGWTTDVSAEMPVSPDEAVEAAQSYLDAYLPGTQVEDEVDPFYGYYTIHTLQDGEVAGMLSVNGYTGQVWLHSWHGSFVEMSEHSYG